MANAKLHRFEGREVIGTRIAITKASDGLSKALAIEPTELAIGQKVYVVLECEVGKITHEPIKDTGSLTRVQTLNAGTATLVDQTLVADVLEAQRIKLEEAEGITRLDFADGDLDPAADDEG